jgi:hypothetical protein
MGVDFYCNNKTFGCSYGGWNERRIYILKITYKYLIDAIKNQKNEIYTQEELEQISKSYLEVINKIFEFGSISSVDKFKLNIHNTYFALDILIKFDVGGLYALINKNDYEGQYTPGNSLDICKLLDVIKPYFDKDDEDVSYIYNSIYVPNIFGDDEADSGYVCIYELFEESWKTCKKINIC